MMPNDTPLYLHSQSNHPPGIVSSKSAKAEVFKHACRPTYQMAKAKKNKEENQTKMTIMKSCMNTVSYKESIINANIHILVPVGSNAFYCRIQNSLVLALNMKILDEISISLS